MLFFLLPFDIVPFVGGRSVATPAILGLGLVWIWHVVKFGRMNALPRGIGLILYLLILWCATTIFWTASPAASARGLLSLASNIVLLIILVDVLPGIMAKAPLWIAAGGAALSIWVLSVPVTDEADRVQVGGVDQNVTSLVLCVCAAASVYLIVFNRGRVLTVLPLLGLLVGAILRVGSRTGSVALGAILMVVILVGLARALKGSSGEAFRTGIVALIVVGSVSFAHLAGLLPTRLSEFISDPRAASDSQRSLIIELYKIHWGEWWVHGIGYGADAAFLRMQGTGHQNAHSLLWKTWIETGLPGILLLGALIFGALYIAMSNPMTGLLGLICAVPLGVFALTLGGDRVTVFWVVLSLCLVARHTDPDAAVRSVDRMGVR